MTQSKDPILYQDLNQSCRSMTILYSILFHLNENNSLWRRAGITWRILNYSLVKDYVSSDHSKILYMPYWSFFQGFAFSRDLPYRSDFMEAISSSSFVLQYFYCLSQK